MSEFKNVPLQPTKEMVDQGAQRLVSWEDGCKWPDSWSPLQVLAAKTEAERVWRSMWSESSAEPACSKVDLEVELSLAVDARDKYERMMLRMREALQKIYSHNGEDPVIARICNELIEASRDY